MGVKVMSIRIRNLASRFSLESGGGRVISSAQMLAHFHHCWCLWYVVLGLRSGKPGIVWAVQMHIKQSNGHQRASQTSLLTGFGLSRSATMDAVLDSVKLRWPTWDLHGSPWMSCEAQISMPNSRRVWVQRSTRMLMKACNCCSLKQRTVTEMSQIGSQWTYAPYPNKTFCCPTRQDTSASTGDSMDIEFEKDPQHVPALSIYIYIYNSISNTEHTESWPQMHHITPSALLWGPSNSGHWTYRSCAPQTVRGHKQGEKKNSRALSQPRSIFVFETQTIERTWESLARCLDSVQRKESVSLICHSENGNSYFIYSIHIYIYV